MSSHDASQDTYNHLIRRVDIATGVTTTLAGSGLECSELFCGSAGFLDGASGSAKFYLPFGVDIDPTSTFALVAVRAVSPEPASGGCFLPSATPPLPQPHCIPLCLRGQ